MEDLTAEVTIIIVVLDEDAVIVATKIRVEGLISQPLEAANSKLETPNQRRGLLINTVLQTIPLIIPPKIKKTKL